MLGIFLIKDGVQIFGANINRLGEGDGGVENGFNSLRRDGNSKPADEVQGFGAATGNKGQDDTRGHNAFGSAETIIVVKHVDGGGGIVNGLGDKEAAAVVRLV